MDLFNETQAKESTEEAVSPKKKRVRRTKAEMEAARAAEQEVAFADSDDKEQWPIVKQLSYVQQHMRCPKKNYNNTSDDGFPYRTTQEIYAAVKPVLNEVGCVIYNSEVELKEGANGNYFILSLVFENIRQEKRITRVIVKESEDMSLSNTQVSGGMMTYATKYALCQMLLIDDNDDMPDMDALPVNKTTKEQVIVDKEPKPVLTMNSPEYKKEVFQLFNWKSTKEDYVLNLKSRYDVDDTVIENLLKLKTSFAA